MELGSILQGPNGTALMRLLAGITMSKTHGEVEPEVWSLGRDLGWVNTSNQLTDLGWKVADPFREYLMWEERGRVIHYWNRGVLRAESFQGKFLVELGSGFGVNLLSLQALTRRSIGVDIEPIYAAFAPVLAARAGLEAPEIQITGADNVDVNDGDVDVILSMGALQYMPIRETLKEAGRILAPGGTAIFIHSHFAGHVRLAMERWVWRPKQMAREFLTLAGMVAYPYFGKLTRPQDPIYPTQRQMKDWLLDAGLVLDPDRTQVLDDETCYVATKD